MRVLLTATQEMATTCDNGPAHHPLHRRAGDGADGKGIDMKTGDRFLELDERMSEFYGHARIVTVVEIKDGFAVVESSTNRPGKQTRIHLQRLTNPRLFKPLDEAMAEATER